MSRINLLRDRADSTSSMMVDDNISRWKLQVTRIFCSRVYNSTAMIPIKLHLSGFLSYRNPVEVDFTSFDLACISGSNGAGKSSLLDAITWSLFGQARKRDDSIVNLQSDAAEVAFTFSYEENTYRVQRSLPRGKGTTLEFQVLDGGYPKGTLR